jgi:hypothetical protein
MHISQYFVIIKTKKNIKLIRENPRYQRHPRSIKSVFYYNLAIRSAISMAL